MTDATTIIPPLADNAALALTRAHAMNNAAFLAEIAQAQLAGDEVPPEPNPDAFSGVENLLNVDTPTLSLLSELSVAPENAAPVDDLTLQEALLKDEQGLEEAARLTTPIPLTDNATTVDLSPEAQEIAFGNPAPAAAVVAPLTPVQLEQLGNVLAPFAEEPLTPPVLLRIQEQLQAAGLTPLQFNLATIVLVMNFMAGMRTSPYHLTDNSVSVDDEETVAPASPIDRVAIENGAILGE